MTAKLIAISAYERRAPQRPHYDDPFHMQMRCEIADLQCARIAREFADEFPVECWSDPAFWATGGLI